MKILINRISNRMSGAEVYNLYLLKSLQEFKDLDITFSSDNEELNEKVKKLGNKVISIFPGVNEIGTKKQFLHATFNMLHYFQKFFQLLINTDNFDIVIFESMTEKIFLTLLLRLFRKKVIWIEHGPLFSTRRASLIKWLYKTNNIFVNKIICVSKSTEEDLRAGGINGKKMTVIYIGIDEKEFAPLDQKEIFRMKSKLGISKKDVIGFLGTITKEKGIIDFLETATLLLKERSNLFFLVIGNGNMLEWLKTEVKQRKISDMFFFTGFIKNVKEYLGIMDILLFPSYHQEGLSIALLEASSMGVPSVATDIGGNKEIILNNKSGILYRNSSSSKIKDLLVEALSNKKTLRTNARRVIVDRYSMRESGVRFYNLFQQIYEN